MADVWVGNLNVKQHHMPTGAEAQAKLDPSSKNPLATAWHGRSMNDHVYTGPLEEGLTVFKYAPLQKGAMATLLSTSPGTVPMVKENPKGRFRSVDGFFE